MTRSLQTNHNIPKSDQEASLKLWDIRKANEPVWAWRDASLTNYKMESNVTLSANERIVIAGSGPGSKGDFAFLHAYDTKTGHLICKEKILPVN